jgi:hypothetical protein
MQKECVKRKNASRKKRERKKKAKRKQNKAKQNIAMWRRFLRLFWTFQDVSQNNVFSSYHRLSP